MQQEVEDALTGFLQSQKSQIYLAEAVTTAKLSENPAFFQYQSGATDYSTVTSARQFLLSDKDSLAVAQGAVPLGLIAVYRSLGGGWELREGKHRSSRPTSPPPWAPAPIGVGCSNRRPFSRSTRVNS